MQKVDLFQSNTYEYFADEYARAMKRTPENRFSFNHDLVIPRLLDIVGDVAGLSVLDAGCGEGIVTRALAARGAQATGIDVSPRLIELAQAQGVAQQIVYRAHNLRRNRRNKYPKGYGKLFQKRRKE